MTITPEQLVAITAKLSVSLSTLTDDKLIELCLLYRSAPAAKADFPDLLKAEITRRFTAAEITSNDVMFSVIQNFSNQFDHELQYKEKMYEFINALDRDLWLTQNITFFEQLIEIPDRMAWVANNGDIMSVLSTKGVAMTRIAASSVAMANIAVSSAALTKIVVSTVARNALMNNNSVFQGVRQQVYDTIKTSWVKKAGVSQASNPSLPLTNINSAVSAPQGFVFASLGWNSTFTAGTVEAKHPNGVIANTAGTSSTPTTLAKLDAISFDGATFKGGAGNYPVGYAELWSPT